MTGILDSFIDGLDDGWNLEDVYGEASDEPKRKAALPTITWLRQHLKRHGPQPRQEV